MINLFKTANFWNLCALDVISSYFSILVWMKPTPFKIEYVFTLSLEEHSSRLVLFSHQTTDGDYTIIAHSATARQHPISTPDL